MKNKNRKLLAVVWLLVLSMGLSGCTLLQFDDPAEIKQQEEELEKQQNITLPDAQALLKPDKLVMDEHLTSEDGADLAVYQAEFPWFEAGEYAALQNINSYYEGEFSHLASDKDRFFRLVEEKPSNALRSSTFSYELLDAPAGYIAILRAFESVDTLGSTGKIYTCDLFEATTGWKLKFSDLFGAQEKAALGQLRTDLATWCADKSYDAAWLDGLTDDLLTQNITLSTETLYVGFDRTVVPGGETLIELDLTPYTGWLKTVTD